MSCAFIFFGREWVHPRVSDFALAGASYVFSAYYYCFCQLAKCWQYSNNSNKIEAPAFLFSLWSRPHTPSPILGQRITISWLPRSSHVYDQVWSCSCSHGAGAKSETKEEKKIKKRKIIVPLIRIASEANTRVRLWSTGPTDFFFLRGPGGVAFWAPRHNSSRWG